MTTQYTNPPISQISIHFLFKFESWKEVAYYFFLRKDNSFPESTLFFKDHSSPVAFTEDNFKNHYSNIERISFIKESSDSIIFNRNGVLFSGQRNDDSYPTFSSVCKFAHEYLPHITYQSCSGIVIAYIDDVYLPKQKAATNLGKYFNHAIFSSSTLFECQTTDFDFSLAIQPPTATDNFVFHCRTWKTSRKNDERIQLQWCYFLNPETFGGYLKNYDARLEDAHGFIHDCFEKFITDECRTIFQQKFVNNYEVEE